MTAFEQVNGKVGIIGVSPQGVGPAKEDHVRPRILLFPEGRHVIAYRATLDVPVQTLLRLTAWLAQHRRRSARRRARAGAGCRT